MDLHLEDSKELGHNITCFVCYVPLCESRGAFVCEEGHWRCAECIHHETLSKRCNVCVKIGLMRNGIRTNTVCPFRFKSTQMHRLESAPSRVTEANEEIKKLKELLEEGALSAFYPFMWSTNHAISLLYLKNEASRMTFGSFLSLPSAPLFPTLPGPPFIRDLEEVDLTRRMSVVLDQHGCNAALNVQNYRQHTSSCGFGWTSCPFSPHRCNSECPRAFRINDLDRHAYECLYQPVICKECHETTHLIDFQLHRKVCPGGALRGADPSAQFLSFEEGWNLAFPFLDCPLKDLGCDHKVRKYEINAHLQERAAYHIGMMQVAMEKQSSTKTKLRNEIELMENCLKEKCFGLQKGPMFRFRWAIDKVIVATQKKISTSFMIHDNEVKVTIFPKGDKDFNTSFVSAHIRITPKDNKHVLFAVLRLTIKQFGISLDFEKVRRWLVIDNLMSSERLKNEMQSLSQEDGLHLEICVRGVTDGLSLGLDSDVAAQITAARAV